MKKIGLNTVVGVVIAFAVMLPAFAEEASTSNPVGRTIRDGQLEPRDLIMQKREEMRAHAEEKRVEAQNAIRARKEEVKTGIQGKREELRQRLDERRKQTVVKYFECMVHRLNAAIDRQEKFIERIESRIQKFKERGANVAEAERLIAEAQVTVQDAKNALTAAEAAFEDLKSSDDPKALFAEVRELVHGVTQSVKDAHAAIVKAITALKGASTGVIPSATPPAGAPAE